MSRCTSSAQPALPIDYRPCQIHWTEVQDKSTQMHERIHIFSHTTCNTSTCTISWAWAVFVNLSELIHPRSGAHVGHASNGTTSQLLGRRPAARGGSPLRSAGATSGNIVHVSIVCGLTCFPLCQLYARDSLKPAA